MARVIGYLLWGGKSHWRLAIGVARVIGDLLLGWQESLETCYRGGKSHWRPAVGVARVTGDLL